MADGFLGRWSRRKLDIQQGRPVEPEPPAPAPAPPVPATSPVQGAVAGAASPPSVADSGSPRAAEPPPPPPSLEDVASLTPESDFSRFAASDVPPEVRNAAMKKLFADPHFNVMDGLDVYIDDYSLPDPMPERMLKSLAGAEFLGLFREEKPKDPREPGDSETAGDRGAQSVAQSAPLPTDPGPSPGAAPAHEPTAPDADPDLRLQQDDAPGPQGPGDGAR